MKMITVNLNHTSVTQHLNICLNTLWRPLYRLKLMLTKKILQ